MEVMVVLFNKTLHFDLDLDLIELCPILLIYRKCQTPVNYAVVKYTDDQHVFNKTFLQFPDDSPMIAHISFFLTIIQFLSTK